MSKVTLNGIALENKYAKLANNIAALTRTDRVGKTAVTNAILLGMDSDGNFPPEFVATLETIPNDAMVEVAENGTIPAYRFTWENLKKWLELTSKIAPYVKAMQEVEKESVGLFERDGKTSVAQAGDGANFADLVNLLG